MVGENKIESKTLKYLQKMDDSDEVVTMITIIRKIKGEPIVIREFTKEVQNVDLVKVQGSPPTILQATP